jgi:hypothetical protein
MDPMPMLSFLDDGNGMTPTTLHRMLSFGYCDKVRLASCHSAVLDDRLGIFDTDGI